jgi:hypothetical protein
MHLPFHWPCRPGLPQRRLHCRFIPFQHRRHIPQFDNLTPATLFQPLLQALCLALPHHRRQFMDPLRHLLHARVLRQLLP